MENKITEGRLVHWLCRNESPFFWKKNFCCVPNVSYGLLPWEADLLICSKSGYLVEVEVKISATDWKSDKIKKKFIYIDDPGMSFTPHIKAWKRIREFWYAAPMKLAKHWKEFDLPTWVGIIGIDLEKEKSWENGYKIFRFPTTDKKAKKLTDLEKAHLARLGTIRIWTSNHLTHGG